MVSDCLLGAFEARSVRRPEFHPALQGGVRAVARWERAGQELSERRQAQPPARDERQRRRKPRVGHATSGEAPTLDGGAATRSRADYERASVVVRSGYASRTAGGRRQCPACSATTNRVLPG